MLQSPRAIGTVVILAVVGIVGAGYACSSLTTIDPGHVGVSVKKCGGGGVSDHPIPTGYYWRSVWCEDVVEYPTNPATQASAGNCQICAAGPTCRTLPDRITASRSATANASP